MEMKRNNILLITFLLAASAEAQELTFQSFLNQVKEKNISYIAEKYNVDIADANVQAARVFNDPELSVSYSNNQDHTMQMGQSYEGELSYSLPLANVRGARIGVSKAEKDVADASVADFFAGLKADASLCYYNALKQQCCVELLRSTYEQMNQLAVSDSLKLAIGEGTQTDALQSRLEAQTMYNDYLQAEAELRNTLTNLSVLMGDKELRGIGTLEENWEAGQPLSNIDNLLLEAENNRADLMTAIHEKTLSEQNLRLVKANRALELGLSLGFAHNTIVENEIAPAPRHNSVSIGVSVPLKFSNHNKGEVRAAKAAIEQSQATVEAIRMQIRSEVMQAYNSFLASEKIARRFSTQMVEDANTILKNKVTGYKQGETSLIEVLDAQRTFNEVSESYYESLCNAAVARVELERAIGR